MNFVAVTAPDRKVSAADPAMFSCATPLEVSSLFDSAKTRCTAVSSLKCRCMHMKMLLVQLGVSAGRLQLCVQLSPFKPCCMHDR